MKTLHLFLNMLILALVMGISPRLQGQCGPAGDLPGAASDNGVTPGITDGNPTCTAAFYKVYTEGVPVNGMTYNGVITTSSSNSYTFSFTSTVPVYQVIVKAGACSNIYSYPDGTYADGNLHGPVKSDGSARAIGRVDFCYKYKLEVSKTAETEFTRTYDWTIDKTVTPEVLDLFTGDAGNVTYKIRLIKDEGTDSNWKVSGKIIIYNPSDKTVDFTLNDAFPGASGVVVSCPTFSIPAKNTVTCAYMANSDGTPGDNTATVTTSTPGIVGGSATAAFAFTTPTTLVNDHADVKDTNGGEWTFARTDSLTYDQTFTCGTGGTFTNTATVKGDDGGILDEDDATVTVNCYALTVTKKAETSYTRKYLWDIQKTVDPAELHLFAGESAGAQYTVKAIPSGFEEFDFKVSGYINIYNPAPMAAKIATVNDVIPGGLITLDCPTFPILIPGESVLRCHYSAKLSDKTDGTNTATATLENTPSGTTDFSGSVAFTFGDPTTEVNKIVGVQDNMQGFLGTADHSSGETTFNYSRTFSCGADKEYPNTAYLVDELGNFFDSDDARVKVYCYTPSIAKNAKTKFVRNWNWTIDKTGDQTDLTLSTGQSFMVNYQVALDATYTDSDWIANGIITITNPHPTRSMDITLTDEVSDGSPVSLGCSSTLTVPANSTVTCGYTVPLGDASTRTNFAFFSLYGRDYLASADIVFDLNFPAYEYDECIAINDTYAGPLGTLCASSAPKTYNYSRWIGPYGVCGEYSVENTVSFVTADHGVTGSDSWTVLVHVPCVGCTLTPGYWKTHSNYGPAPYDDIWATKGEDTPFFLSGQSYYEVLWTNPKGGNAYYILAHAYIAAELNMLAGADGSAIADAFAQATKLFNAWTPAQIANKKLNKAIRDQFIYLAGILDSYNNGYIGPGHCSEPSSDYMSGISIPVTPGIDLEEAPLKLSASAFPNPFGDAVTLTFNLPYDSEVSVEIFNLNGQRVQQLFRGQVSANTPQQVVFNASTLPTEIYLYRIISDREIVSGKLFPLR